MKIRFWKVRDRVEALKVRQLLWLSFPSFPPRRPPAEKVMGRRTLREHVMELATLLGLQPAHLQAGMSLQGGHVPAEHWRAMEEGESVRSEFLSRVPSTWRGVTRARRKKTRADKRQEGREMTTRRAGRIKEASNR